MKRKKDVFVKIVTTENLRRAIQDVINSHKWLHYPDKPNKTSIWLQNTIDERVEELRTILVNGFEPSPCKKMKRYDRNAGKWREISEPRLYPDQCVHHALVQVLEPIMMKGMDHWCCGSIKGRGAHYGVKALKNRMKRTKGMKWCVEADIKHFYDSLSTEEVVAKMKTLIKDYRALDLIERITKDGVLIGAYCSQWFANTFLQDLDRAIRQNGITFYIRYMDNFTIFTARKRNADKVIAVMIEWLHKHNLELKENWQKFQTDKRLPNALGYRFGHGYTLLRKKNRIRLIHLLKRFYRLRERNGFIAVKFAQGLLSLIGMYRHCNSYQFYKQYVKQHTQRKLKNIVREWQKGVHVQWSMYLAQNSMAA